MKITVEGIDYVEDALLKPDLPTQHFPPVSILITGDIHHSQIQHGNIGSTQTVSIQSNDLEQIRLLLSAAREHVSAIQDPAKKAEAEAELATLDAQLGSPSPKHSILRESLKSLRSILEQTVSGAAASPIGQFLAQWLLL